MRVLFLWRAWPTMRYKERTEDNLINHNTSAICMSALLCCTYLLHLKVKNANVAHGHRVTFARDLSAFPSSVRLRSVFSRL